MGADTSPPLRSRGSRTGDFFFNADATLVGMAADDGSVTIFDTSDGTEVVTMAGLTGSLAAEFLSDATVISASWTHSGSAVWAVDGKPAIGRSQRAGLDGILGVKLLDNGAGAALLATSGVMTTAPTADVRTVTLTRQIGDAARAFDVSETAGIAAAYVLDIDQVRQVGQARRIEIVRLDDLSSLRTIEVTDRPVANVAFDPSGTRLAVGSEGGETVAVINRDGTLRLFDVETGRTVGPTLTGHPVLSLTLELAPTGQLVSAGVDDDTVIEWDLDPDDWLERACELVGRDLTEQEWSDYVGGPYRPTCTNLPADD